MTHPDISSSPTSSSEAPDWHCSDIWFHLSGRNSVSPRLTNAGLPTTGPGERRAGPRVAATGELQSPLAFGLQTDPIPGGSEEGPAGREASSAPINTPSLRQAAVSRLREDLWQTAGAMGGWGAGRQARLRRDPRACTVNVLVPRAAGRTGERRDLLLRGKLREGENQPSLVK